MKHFIIYKKYNSIIKNTSAIFCQPLELQKFVLNKKLYMETLAKKGIPVMDHISFLIKDNMNSTTMINKIKKQCEVWGQIHLLQNHNQVVFKSGFKKWDLQKVVKNDKQFKSYLKKIEKQVRIEKPLLLVQDFVPEFEKFYEVRTYWLNGQYCHAM